MTVNELIERLQECVDEDEANGEREVLLATQPSWPLQYHVRGACTSEEAHEYDEPDEDNVSGDPECVYIVEGGQHYDRPYAPRGAFDAAAY
jgi:hypothetical protein